MCLLGRASRRLHQNGTHGLAVLPITVSRQNLAASLGRVACMAECRGDEDRNSTRLSPRPAPRLREVSR